MAGRKAAGLFFLSAAVFTLPAVAAQPVHCFITDCLSVSEAPAGADSGSCHKQRPSSPADAETASSDCYMNMSGDSSYISLEKIHFDLPQLSVYFESFVSNPAVLKRRAFRPIFNRASIYSIPPVYLANQTFLI